MPCHPKDVSLYLLNNNYGLSHNPIALRDENYQAKGELKPSSRY